MEMHLEPEIFELVKNGTKNVEARLFDEKRKQLRVGDEITVYKRPDDEESIKIRITGFKVFSDFDQMADYYPIERLYMSEWTKEQFLSLIHQFYSDEDIAKYGTVAIEFEIISEAKEDEPTSTAASEQAPENEQRPRRKTVKYIKKIALIVVLLIIARPLIGLIEYGIDTFKFTTIGTINYVDRLHLTEEWKRNNVYIRKALVIDDGLYFIISLNSSYPIQTRLLKFDLKSNDIGWTKDISLEKKSKYDEDDSRD